MDYGQLAYFFFVRYKIVFFNLLVRNVKLASFFFVRKNIMWSKRKKNYHSGSSLFEYLTPLYIRTFFNQKLSIFLKKKLNFFNFYLFCCYLTTFFFQICNKIINHFKNLHYITFKSFQLFKMGFNTLFGKSIIHLFYVFVVKRRIINLFR